MAIIELSGSWTVVALTGLVAYFGLGRLVLSMTERYSRQRLSNLTGIVWSVSWPLWLWIGRRRAKGRK